MPYRPKGACALPGCSGRATHDGRCELHARIRRAEYEAGRLPASERGYDAAWRKARAAHLRAYPTCEACGAPATDVHHVNGIAAGNGPDNLASVCRRCHNRLTHGKREHRD